LISLKGAAIVGRSDARVALLEYSDFECPYCGRFTRDTLPALTSKYLTPGFVQFAFRHLPAQPIHPHADAAARSAICAGQQNRFWPMHDRLFANQRDLTDESVLRLARAVGLDMVAYNACFNAGEKGMAATLVKRDVDEAKRLHVVATPTFLAGVVELDQQLRVRTVIQGARSAADFSTVLDSLVNATR
jgi:protein-disulfide isomerase